MSIKITGIKQALKNLDDFGQTVTQKLEDATDEATVNIERNAKQDVAVDEAILKTSIHRNRNGLDGSVFTNEPYAPYVEFGTGSLVDVPEGLEDYAMQFKGKGIREVNLPARPFLFPAWESERPKYIKRIKKVLKGGAKR